VKKGHRNPGPRDDQADGLAGAIIAENGSAELADRRGVVSYDFISHLDGTRGCPHHLPLLEIPMTDHALMASMDQAIDGLDRLHSSPHVACQALRLLQDDNVETCQLVQCLETDPALASNVLRLVNSSYFGLARNVSSLRHAVTLLGMRSLRLAVLSFGLLEQLAKDVPARVYDDFWRRSLTMASVASRLVPRKQDVAGDEAYSAGLLADVGVLLLAQLDTRQYSRLYNKAGHSEWLLESERERYGYDHGQLGARLLDRWNLPPLLTRAVAGHHQRPESSDALAMIIYLASLIADSLWTPDSPRVKEARVLAEAECGLDLDGFITLAVDCKEIIRDSAQMYQIHLGRDINCAALVDQARRQYMEEAMEAAIDWDSLEAIALSP
jgi:HD-like signal output (HDOD) protein